MHTCADIVSSVPFFEDAEEGFTTSIVTCLRPQVSMRGDIIVREGEVSREMYFIKAGAAQARDPKPMQGHLSPEHETLWQYCLVHHVCHCIRSKNQPMSRMQG